MIKEVYYDIKQLRFLDDAPNNPGLIIKRTPFDRLLSLIKNVDLDFFNFEVYGDYDILKISFDTDKFNENDVRELIETRAQMLYWRHKTDEMFEKLNNINNKIRGE